jgi:hypothetical protein
VRRISPWGAGGNCGFGASPARFWIGRLWEQLSARELLLKLSLLTGISFLAVFS